MLNNHLYHSKLEENFWLDEKYWRTTFLFLSRSMSPIGSQSKAASLNTIALSSCFVLSLASLVPVAGAAQRLPLISVSLRAISKRVDKSLGSDRGNAAETDP